MGNREFYESMGVFVPVHSWKVLTRSNDYFHWRCKKCGIQIRVHELSIYSKEKKRFLVPDEVDISKIRATLNFDDRELTCEEIQIRKVMNS